MTSIMDTTLVPTTSPVEAIEDQVKARAKQLALDVTHTGGEHELRRLIAEVITDWNENYRR